MTEAERLGEGYGGLPEHPGEIRLACGNCDREDADGVTSIPEGWRDVGEADHLEEGSSEWWTHIGTCPDCAAEEDAKALFYLCKLRDAVNDQRSR